MSYASKDEQLKRTGRLSQLGGITSFAHADGRARGTATLRVKTAAGLEFWVVPDRGMDIYEASFRGRSLCWHAPQGMVHPAYYSNRGLEWLKTFSGGLLTTCGLTTAGGPSHDDGEDLGLHGAVSAIPAERVNWTESWDGGDCFFEISGRVREAGVHGANVVMERRITSSLHSTALTIEDVVTNEGVRTSPLMVLYHLNFGYPLLTERSRVVAPSKVAHPVDELSRESIDRWMEFEAPVRNQRERVYFHDMAAKQDGWVDVVLVSDQREPDFAVKLSYDSASLPQFAQWKMTGENHFVQGLEPSNCRTLGRKAERERGSLQFLEPGETKRFQLRLEVLDDAQKIEQAVQAIVSER